MRFVYIYVVLALAIAEARCAESAETARPITEADSVLAVYCEDSGLGSSGAPGIIFIAWPDGHVVWSADRLKGGPPFHSGQVERQKVSALLERFDREGLFGNESLNRAHFGPDSQFITVLIKSGKKQVKMMSWHELFEVPPDTLVVTDRGAEVLGNRRRLEVLRKEPAEYLFFRMVWSETRIKLSNLLPAQSYTINGGPIMKAGILSWRETVVTP